MKSNPRFDHFHGKLVAGGANLEQSWSGDCWRFQAIEFPHSEDALSGVGARIHGGRWNPRGGFPAVYGSTDEVTATKEATAHSKYYGLVSREPRIFVCIEVALVALLDLTDASIRRRLGLTLKELRAEDWHKLQDANKESLGQCVGRAAFALGFEAMLVPSFANRGGTNLVLFPDNVCSRSTVKVSDESKLAGALKKKP